MLGKLLRDRDIFKIIYIYNAKFRRALGVKNEANVETYLTA